jgi:hypothetical protein
MAGRDGIPPVSSGQDAAMIGRAGLPPFVAVGNNPPKNLKGEHP